MIKNHDKSNVNFQNQEMIAGIMPSDHSVEFYGIKNNKQVIWFQNGSTNYFSDLPIQYLQLIKAEYLKHPKAVAFLKAVTDSFPRQLELFTYYMYGALDSTPDIKDGVLSAPENFRDSKNCPSLLWNCKQIIVNNYALTPRELIITDFFFENTPDKAIAQFVGISHSYLDQVKHQLFKKTGVTTKVAYLIAAIQQQAV